MFSHSKKKTEPEILRSLEILQKPWENKRFQQPGRRVPGREAMRPPAARPEITVPYHEIIRKSLVFACPGRCNTVQSAESLCAAGLVAIRNSYFAGKDLFQKARKSLRRDFSFPAARKIPSEGFFISGREIKILTPPLAGRRRAKISTRLWPAGPAKKTVHAPGRPALRKNQYAPPDRPGGRPGGAY